MSQQQSSLAVEPFRHLQPPGEKTTLFVQVLDDFEHGWLRVPIHQRDPDAWDANKKKKYVDRLRESRVGAHPTGAFATYQIPLGVDAANGSVSEGSPVYLNDGFQRLTTLRELRADPSLFGMDPEGVMQLLRQDCCVQHRHYESHEVAMREFQLINYGTRLTPLELCMGFLKYMPDYEVKWKPILDGVHEAIEQSDNRLWASSHVRREVIHKRRRHRFALFYRFLTEDKAPRQYIDVSRREVELDVERRDVIEWRLRVAMEALGPEASKLSANRFVALVARETALLEEVRNEVLGGGVGLTPLLHRWLLDFAVWCKNNKKTVDAQRHFISIMLRETGGKSQWHVPDSDKKKTVTLTFAHLGTLPELSKLAGMPDLCVKQVRRKSNSTPLRAGYQNSHLEPFVEYGEGHTFAESGSANMARGAKPVG